MIIGEITGWHSCALLASQLGRCLPEEPDPPAALNLEPEPTSKLPEGP